MTDHERSPDPAATPDGGRHLPVHVGPGTGWGPEIEVVEARPVERPPEPALPTPLAVAAGGFVAGFVTFAAVRLLREAHGRLLGGRRGHAVEREIVGTRSFLVDVHVLKR